MANTSPPFVNGDKVSAALANAFVVYPLKQTDIDPAEILTAAWQDKGGQVFNVKAYGAAGNDVADDTSAFQNALTAAAGQTLFIPPGTYIVNARLRPASNTIVRGAGMGSSIVKRKVGFTQELFLPADASVRAAFLDFTLDGNYPANTTNIGAEISSSAGSSFTLFQRIEIRNPRGGGIGAIGLGTRILDCLLHGLASTASPAGFGIWFDDASAIGTLISRCIIRDWTHNGIYGGGSGYRIEGCHFSGNHYSISPTGGGQVAWGSSAEEGSVVGNYFAAGGGAATSGIEVDNTDGLVIADNVLIGQQVDGIILQGGTNTIVKDNVIKNSGTAGINVDPGVSGFQLIGNRCYDTGPATQDYGIIVQAGASDNYVIADNDLRGNVTAGLSDGGTGANKRVHGNLPISEGGVNLADSATIGNTTTLTAFNKTWTFPANTLNVGDVLRIRAGGLISTDAAGAVTLTLRATVGTSQVVAYAQSVGGGAVNGGWWMECDVAIRSLGASGTMRSSGGVGATPSGLMGTTISTTTVAIDTTIANAVSLSAQWAAARAGDSIKIATFSAHRLGSGAMS